jgi:hypothetical protein
MSLAMSSVTSFKRFPWKIFVAPAAFSRATSPQCDCGRRLRCGDGRLGDGRLGAVSGLSASEAQKTKADRHASCAGVRNRPEAAPFVSIAETFVTLTGFEALSLDSAGKQVTSATVLHHRKPRCQRSLGLIGDLETGGVCQSSLDVRRAIFDGIAGPKIFKPQANEITGPQLAVVRKI